jgi:hypothetical protein
MSGGWLPALSVPACWLLDCFTRPMAELRARLEVLSNPKWL